MNHVSIPKDPDSSVQLRPLVDFRGPYNNHPKYKWVYDHDPEKFDGVIPDRPNHLRGCVYRYGASAENGFKCKCPGRNTPEFMSKKVLDE